MSESEKSERNRVAKETLCYNLGVSGVNLELAQRAVEGGEWEALVQLLHNWGNESTEEVLRAVLKSRKAHTVTE